MRILTLIALTTFAAPALAGQNDSKDCPEARCAGTAVNEVKRLPASDEKVKYVNDAYDPGIVPDPKPTQPTTPVVNQLPTRSVTVDGNNP